MKLNQKQLGSYLKNSNTPYMVLDEIGLPIDWNDEAEKIIPSFFKAITKNNGFNELKKLSAFFNNYVTIPLGTYEIEVNDSDTVKNKKLIFNTSKTEDNCYFITILDVTKKDEREKYLIAEMEQTEKTSLSRSLFLANVSHEIKTPIQIIIGMLDLLKTTNLDNEQSEYIRQLIFSSDVLLALVNDILDFSKLEAGRIEIESIEFDLFELLQQTAELISLEAHKKGLEIILDISEDIHRFLIGDPKRIQQVLFNFLKNAVKFTEKGVIIISVVLSPIHKSKKTNSIDLIFEVIDTGIGIDPKQEQKLFSPFMQADASTSRKYGGTGLGLAISKNLIELMHGTIGVSSNFPNGSVFWFALNLKLSNRPVPEEETLLNKNTRFLIIDDNNQSAIVLERNLRKFGFSEVLTMENQIQAIELMKEAARHQHPFDIVFIDMIMPKMDGWRVGNEIHNCEELAHSKIFLMIPEGTLGADAKMKLLDWFDGYLYKPIQRDELFTYLNDISRLEISPDEIEELEPIDDQVPNIGTETTHNNKKILVVEDNPINRQMLKLILEKSGYTVDTKENGQEAINYFEDNNTADLVFMDVQMPVLNGYEAAKLMREMKIEIPIIACTASAQANEGNYVKQFGMTDVIVKPFNAATLVAMVEKHIKGNI